MEIIADLTLAAGQRLKRLGYRKADGYQGWPERAPFDGILVTAATHIPPPLVEQLKPGARLVIPVGLPYMSQHLMVVEKDPTSDQLETKLDSRYPWAHGVWHLFMLAGSTSHYFTILFYA